jgi:LacI family transcriptional regulator
MSHFVSMSDIARKVGVSRSTVSLALQGSPEIPLATREKVKAAARQMGYRPNPYLTALMRSRRKGKLPASPPTLAFVTFFPTRRGWVERFPGLIKTLESASKQAESRGFRIEEFWTPLSDFTPHRIGEILYTRGITGVILSPFPQPTRSFDWQWDRFAAVAIGPTLLDRRAHRVRNNHFESGLIIFNECRRLGYRRIGLALRTEINRRLQHRWTGAYLARQLDEGMTEPAPLVTDDWNRTVFLRWVEEQRPEVVVVSRYEEPTEWLASAGYRIPQDIGLVTFACPFIGSPFSGVYDNWEQQGIRAANLLVDKVTYHELGAPESPDVSLVDSIWNPGTTIRQQPSETSAK